MSTKTITAEQREFADDMGYAVCESCAATYSPLLGWANDGHQCDEDGTKPKFMIPLTYTSLAEIGYTREEAETEIRAWDDEMLLKHGIVTPRPNPDDQTD